MRLNGAHYRIKEDGNRYIKFNGIDMGNECQILLWLGDYIVFKRKGFTGWYAVCETRYFPVEFYLIKINETAVTDTIDTESPVDGRSWQRIKRDFIEKAKRLNEIEK
jgi:hypothetical protein